MDLDDEISQSILRKVIYLHPDWVDRGCLSAVPCPCHWLTNRKDSFPTKQEASLLNIL